MVLCEDGSLLESTVPPGCQKLLSRVEDMEHRTLPRNGIFVDLFYHFFEEFLTAGGSTAHLA
jgi:hypothetical protein